MCRLKSELPPEVKVVLSDGLRGLSETRNVALRYVSGGILTCIDDDTVANANWLEKRVSAF